MENRELLKKFYKAQNGDENSIKEILKEFKPLIYKNSFINGKFDEDCFQELNIKLMSCIQQFRFSPDMNIYKCFDEFLTKKNFNKNRK
jgi:hypothetical protein